MGNSTQQSEVTACTPSPERLGCAKAFRKWRGKKPTTGYGYDLMKWEYETRDMRLAWDAAVAWCLSHNTGSDQPREPKANEG